MKFVFFSKYHQSTLYVYFSQFLFGDIKESSFETTTHVTIDQIPLRFFVMSIDAAVYRGPLTPEVETNFDLPV